MKRVLTKADFTSDEDYFLYEEKSELINHNIFEISSVSIHQNDIVLNILFLRTHLTNQQHKVVFENYKVRTSDGNYFCPDVIVCTKEAKKYHAEQPVLIVETLSESTRKFDLINKFIQYQKIETLQYYLCLEPEQRVIFFYYKTHDGEWMTDTFTQDNDTIELKQLSISFTLKDIYKSA